MFFLTLSNMGGLTMFTFLTYLISFTSFFFYILPISFNNFANSNSSNKSAFYFISCSEIFSLFLAPCLIYFSILNFWSSHSYSLWFGHLIFSIFQRKMSIFIIITFLIIIRLYLSVTYISSKEICDFFITKFNFLYWILLLFHVNSIFTTIFIIEILSTLIFLLILTSTFSSCYFYKNLDFSSHSFFENSVPFTLIQSILFFFWISLLSSLNLFLFIILLHNKIFSFDWYLIEHIFLYFINVSSFKNIYVLGIVWSVVIISIFIKCGIAPFYLWKPTFFKGLPFSSLIFYISYFYYFLFLFIIHFLTSYFHELFYFYSFISLIIILIGMFTLLFILCETFYIKTFLAISSILNALLVFIAMVSTHTSDIIFFL